MTPTRKIFAVRLRDYEEARRKRDKEMQKKSKGKRKAPKAFDDEVVEELNNEIDKLVEQNEKKDILTKSILECCICLKVISKVMIATCCNRTVGCKSCVDQWFGNNGQDCCPLCKSNCHDKAFYLKGMEGFRTLISGLDGQ